MSQAQGSSHVTSLQAEGRAELLAAGRTWYRTVARDEIAYFRLQAERTACRIEFFARPDALDQLIAFTLGQVRRLLAFQVGDHPVANFFERSLVRRQDRFYRQNDVATIGANRKACFFLPRAEDGIFGFLRIGELQQGVGCGNGTRLFYCQVKLFRQIVQGYFWRLPDGGC